METDAETGNGGMSASAIVFGAVLLALGGTLLLDRSGLLHVWYGQLIGPLVLITIGAMTIVERGAWPAATAGGAPARSTCAAAA